MSIPRNLSIIADTLNSDGTFASISNTGSTTLSSGTANGVAYLNGSKVLTTGSALSFDGTNLGVVNISGADVTLLTLTSNSGIRQQFNPSNSLGAKYNWRIDVNALVDQSWSLIPSTAVGGSTFSTPVYQANGNGTQIWSVGATEGMRLTSTGLGIGTSSPIVKLHVSTSGNTPIINETTGGATSYLNLRNTGGQAYIAASTNDLLFATSASATERMRIDSSGNVGIGTSSPFAKLQVKTQTNGNAAFQNSTSVSGGVKINCFNDAGNSSSPFEIDGSTLQFNIASVERMRIDSSGNLLVGTTTGRTSKIVVEADGTTTYGVTSNMTAASGTRYHMIFRESGTERGSITSNGTVTVYNTTSDYRLKTVIGAVSGSGERIDALHPVEYTWNSNGQRTRGFLAHQFQEVYADSVTGTKDAVDADGNPKYQAMQAATSEVIADLVAEIQSLRKRLTALESKEIS